MKLKPLQKMKTRRLLPVTSKAIVTLMLLMVAAGGAMAAANDSVTIYTDEDMKAAQKIVDDSGIGTIIALIALTAQYAPYLAVALLVMMVIAARALGNADAHKGALQGILIIIGVMFVWVIAVAVISNTTPDMSTITFGT